MVHSRRWVGHRPQLHRLRSAREWRNCCDVRGRTKLARARSVLENHRRVSGEYSLYCPDRDPRIHSLVRRLGRETRSLITKIVIHSRLIDTSVNVDMEL